MGQDRRTDAGARYACEERRGAPPPLCIACAFSQCDVPFALQGPRGLQKKEREEKKAGAAPKRRRKSAARACAESPPLPTPCEAVVSSPTVCPPLPQYDPSTLELLSQLYDIVDKLRAKGLVVSCNIVH